MTQGGPSERLKATFRGELQDHMRSAERDLLALEGEADPAARAALHTSLFRAVHSLKGAARVVGEAALEMACHRLEEVFQRVRDGRLPTSPVLFRLLFEAVDVIRSTAGAGEEPEAAASLARLSRRLADVIGDAAATEEAGPAKPAAAPASEADAFVRLPAAKLDLLLARSEQLLVARRRAEGLDGALAALEDGLRAQQQRWAQVRREMELVLAQAPAERSTGTGERASGLRRVAALRRALPDYQAEQGRLALDVRTLGEKLAVERRAIEQAAEALDADVRRVRMFPFALACEGLQRTARDIANPSGKAVHVVVEGADLELDRSVLEALRDPLMHLVRNAVDHGAEPPEDRRRAGKPEGATIRVAARLRGAQVEVEVSDDGRGIDVDALADAARGRKAGKVRPVADPLDLIFEPGFSTSGAVTSVSGRGFGLDVVKSRVEAMRGAVSVTTQPGRGTSFRLVLPLTLTTIRGVLVSAGEQVFALEAASVRQLLRIEAAEARPVEGRLVVKHGDEPVALASLASVLGLDGAWTLPTDRKTPVVVLAADGRQAALAVDELLTEQDVVVRTLGPKLRRVRFATGATTLSDGRICLLLNVRDLLGAALAPDARGGEASLPRQAPKAAARLLLADDSVTTRTLVKSILEGAGYDVTPVADGAAALQRLQDGGADLVVTDVEMPRMDGVALTEAIRASPKLRDLPVILVTALESEADRRRGLEAGANAYLVKSAFDQRELLDLVRELL
jgi:two-component system chemotaxis sensor kinase CheA